MISYQGTMEREEETTVMLRIDERYPYGDDSYTDNYFVSFIFDPDGRFKETYIQANVFMDNGFTQRESIVSLDSEMVEAQINHQYSRAMDSKTGYGEILDSDGNVLMGRDLTRKAQGDILDSEGNVLVRRELGNL